MSYQPSLEKCWIPSIVDQDRHGRPLLAWRLGTGTLICDLGGVA